MSRKHKIGASVALGIAGTLGAVVVQIALPAILLRQWDSHMYALMIAVQGLAAYAGAADVGVQPLLLRQLSVLLARGEHARARGWGATSLTLLSGLALLGGGTLVGTAAAAGDRLFGAIAAESGASTSAVLWALLLNVIAAVTGIIFGGWSSAVEVARGRYHLPPLASLVRLILSNVSLVWAALHGLPVSQALAAFAGTAIAVDVARFVGSVDFLRGDRDAIPILDVLRNLRGAPLSALGIATTGGLLPAGVSIAEPQYAATAMPTRTLSNASRLVTGAVVNSLWAPMSVRMEELREDSTERTRLANSAARALAAIHAGSIAGIILVAPLFVPHWLPEQSATILAILPLFLYEQVAGVMLAPAQVTLPAAGRFGYIGGANILAGMTALAIAVLTMPRYGAAGFGLGLAIGALAVAVPMMLVGERAYWRSVGVAVRLHARAAITLVSAVAVSLLFVSATLSALAALLLGGFALRELRRAASEFLPPRGSDAT